MTKRVTQVLFLALVAQASCRAEGTKGTGGGEGGTGGESGTGGGGGGAPCVAASECPPSSVPCVKTTCEDGACGEAPFPSGTLAPGNVEGDCQVQLCDGAGKVTSSPDDEDRPVDGSSCTADVCTNGVPSNPPLPAGATCQEGGGGVCNGNGACVACVASTDCPGEDSACQTRTCNDNVCGVTLAPAGTPLANQIAGDCSKNVCDGAGGTTSTIDGTDVPIDGKACTVDTCTAGVPANPPLPLDTACNQDGGKVCDASGACVQCNKGSQCASGVCAGGMCQPASCVDGVKNGSEADIDCGGAACAPCPIGADCAAASDCTSGVCAAGTCEPPVVSGTTPADGQSGVAVGSTVAVAFSGAMNPATLTAQTTIGPCSGAVRLSTDGFATCLGFAAASPVISGNGTVATFTPAPALSYGTTYSVRVTTQAQGIDGTALGAPYQSSTGFMTVTPSNTCAGSVVISQIYGGGGNAGATFKADFVELHNRGNAPVSLSGWSVQYASAAGSTWLVTNLNGTIAPGGYYLVQGALGNSGGALPAPDAVGMTNMSATAGKVALVKATAALGGSCPSNSTIVDFVGYGTTTTCSEGSGPAAAASSASQSIQRASGACTDTNDNKADFTAAAVAPKNASSPPLVCACAVAGAVNESGLGAEIDLCSVDLPASIAVAAGAMTPAISARVFEAGVTEAAGAAPSVVAQVGFGPANVNPTTESGWQFFPASWIAQAGGADEYAGSFSAPATAGVYRYTYRMSLDGMQWTYCDRNGAGSSSGALFEVTEVPLLTVTP